MPVYVVSYDLNRPGQNYPQLWTELRRLNAQKVLLSQWAINVPNTAREVCDHIWQYMDATDRLLVMDRDSGNWASRNVMIDLNSV